jgi:hypothetical protein
VRSCLFGGRSAVRLSDWDVQTVFCGEQLRLVGRSAVRRANWYVQIFVESNCLLDGRSAVRWADWYIQRVFCGEQLPFGWTVSVPMGGLGFSDRFFC